MNMFLRDPSVLYDCSRGQRSAVRYKNGNVTMETDALTKDNDHTEVDVSRVLFSNSPNTHGRVTSRFNRINYII